MKKKLVSILLSAAMVMTLLAGCGDKKDEAPADGDADVADEGAADDGEAAPAGEIPEAKYYYSFDGAADGATVKVNDFTSEGATTVESRIVDTDTALLYADGVAGQCAYFDGSYGLELAVEPVGDTYSISFWVNAARFSDYGPILDFGSDMYSTNTSAKWVNITKASWVGDSFPTIWSRDEVKDIFPWFNAQDGVVMGKKEWAHIVLVADASQMTSDGIFINGQLYVNGVLQTKTDAEGNLLENQLTPGVFTDDDPSDFHFYLGINCWDTIFKGGIDELYIYDKALTESEVAALYAAGDGTKELVAPESVEAEEEPVAIVLPEIIPDAAAIETVGTVARDNAFWTQTTNGYEIADGETKTITFNNYSDAANNWDNYILAFANAPVTSDLLANAENYEGYAEYVVARADCWSWGNEDFGGTTYESSWGDDWSAFPTMMTAAKITLAITRSGADLTAEATIEGADGNTYTTKYVMTTSLTADAPCYFFLTSEKCYVEVLSVE